MYTCTLIYICVNLKIDEGIQICIFIEIFTLVDERKIFLLVVI